MLNIVSLSNEQKLSPYRQDLLNKLRPTLERLDVSNLDDKSTISEKGLFYQEKNLQILEVIR